MLRLQSHATTNVRSVAGLAAMAAMLAACAATPPDESPGVALWFAGLASASCTVTGSGSGNVPDDVAMLAVSLTWPGAQPRIERTSRAALQGKAGWLLKLPVSSGLDIEAYGCDAQKRVVWMGRSNGFDIESQKETRARVFLAPVGKLACAGSVGGSAVMHSARSLSGATSLANGDAAIVGGIKDWNVSDKSGTGSTAADYYDHRAGVFQKGPDLLTARILPHVFALPAAAAGAKASQVLVIGGSGKVVAYSGLALPSRLMVADKVDAATLPPIHAEVLDITSGSGGKGVQYTGDVGVGWRAFSAGTVAGDDIVLVGGVDDSGAAIGEGTRIEKIAAIAGGGAAQTSKIQLIAPRAGAAVVAFPDGTVLVWGGTPSKKLTDMGELIAPGESGGRALNSLTGPAEWTDSKFLASVGAAVAVLASSQDSLTLLVAGGVPLGSPASAVDALTYAVTVARGAQTAEIKPVKLTGGIVLRAGLGAAATRLPGGQVVFAGGLIALSSTAGICAAGGECILDGLTVLDPPADFGAATLELNATVSKFDTPRFGMVAVAAPAGALLAGGQTSAVVASSTALLIDAGQLLAWTPSAATQTKVCGK